MKSDDMNVVYYSSAHFVCHPPACPGDLKHAQSEIPEQVRDDRKEQVRDDRKEQVRDDRKGTSPG
jgi:hypothetical protein